MLKKFSTIFFLTFLATNCFHIYLLTPTPRIFNSASLKNVTVVREEAALLAGFRYGTSQVTLPPMIDTAIQRAILCRWVDITFPPLSLSAYRCKLVFGQFKNAVLLNVL